MKRNMDEIGSEEHAHKWMGLNLDPEMSELDLAADYISFFSLWDKYMSIPAKYIKIAQYELFHNARDHFWDDPE